MTLEELQQRIATVSKQANELSNSIDADRKELSKLKDELLMLFREVTNLRSGNGPKTTA